MFPPFSCSFFSLSLRRKDACRSREKRSFFYDDGFGRLFVAGWLVKGVDIMDSRPRPAPVEDIFFFIISFFVFFYFILFIYFAGWARGLDWLWMGGWIAFGGVGW